MAPLGPLTTNRLTVRLDPERAARIEYWATENPLKIKSYNQLIQEALDEYLDRHTVSPTHDSLTVKVPQKVREKLHDLQEDGYGNIDQIVSEALLQQARMRDLPGYVVVVLGVYPFAILAAAELVHRHWARNTVVWIVGSALGGADRAGAGDADQAHSPGY